MTIGVSNILCLAAGVGVVLAGLGLLWGHRIAAHDGGDAEVAKRHWAGPSWLTQQMRLVLGASCLIGGYHIAAYGSPDRWFPLKAPREIWWVVPVVILVCVVATAVVDRIVARDP